MAKFHRPDHRGGGRGGRPGAPPAGARPTQGRSDPAVPNRAPRSAAATPSPSGRPAASGKPGGRSFDKGFGKPQRERDGAPTPGERRLGGPSQDKPGNAPRGRSFGKNFDKPPRDGQRSDGPPPGKSAGAPRGRPTGKPYRARPGSQPGDRASPARPPYDRPPSERPAANRVRSERPRSERPAEGRAPSGKPRFEKPGFEKPGFEKPSFEKPRVKRPAGPQRATGRAEARASAPRRERPVENLPSWTEPEAEAPVLAKIERAAPRSDDDLWVYGRHATAAALANPRRRIRRLVALAEAAAALNAALAQAQARLPIGPLPEIVSREILEDLLPSGAVHQGVALAAAALPAGDIEDVIAGLAEPGGAPQIVVLLDQVTDPHNIGAVLRSTAAFGALALVLPEHGAPEPTGTLAKAASGALELVPLVRVVNLARTLDRLKEAGFWCVGLDEAAPQSLAESKLAGRIAIVLGAEGDGMRRLTRERCDLLVRLPTRGALASLNVSNAAAIALYELTRG
jgi:23S rRNA (guanosine2251-2'-O)-methyltransferase